MTYKIQCTITKLSFDKNEVVIKGTEGYYSKIEGIEYNLFFEKDKDVPQCFCKKSDEKIAIGTVPLTQNLLCSAASNNKKVELEFEIDDLSKLPIPLTISSVTLLA